MPQHTGCLDSMWSTQISRTPSTLEKRFPHSFDPEPIVFLGLIVVIPTNDDLPGKTLEVIGAFIVWGIHHGIVCSELLLHEVREAINAVKDPECYQGLHRIRIELREADVQVQQCLPEEWVKRQPEPLEEVVPVHGHIAWRRPSRLVGWPAEPKLHIIRDLVELPKQVHLLGRHFLGVSVHLSWASFNAATPSLLHYSTGTSRRIAHLRKSILLGP